ncbi:MAG: T9SS type A sorting domain-containing protein, partial [Mucilaginibacter sp.]
GSVGYSIVLDGMGNSYTTGSFYGITDFDPGVGTFTLNSANGQIFILKLDAAGNFMWAKNLGNSNLGVGYAIDLDGSGNIYTTGYFQGPADFDPGPGVFTLNAPSSAVFISKLDASGSFLWAKQMSGFNSYSSACGFGIKTDVTGNIYTSGVFYGTIDFDPGAGTYNLSSVPTGTNSNGFLQKLDPNGNFLFARQLLNGRSYAIEQTGSIYISHDSTAYTSLSKYNPSGSLLWEKKMGGHFSASVVTGKKTSVFLYGYFTGTADFDLGPGTFTLTPASARDLFISKLDTSGNFKWVKSLPFKSSNNLLIAATCDPSDHLYLTGGIKDTIDFDPGPGTFTLALAGGSDTFVSSLDSSGNFNCAYSIGTPSNETGYSIDVSPSGDVYTTGYFNGTVDFNPGAGVFNLTASGQNMFIQKVSQPWVGIKENVFLGNFNLYPNPTSGLITMDVSVAYQLIITSTLGQEIINEHKEAGKQILDLHNQASGVYIINIISENKSQVFKLVKD